MTWEVLRDRWGIAHVRGSSVREVAFGQGVACAEDRAWQLDLERLRASGEVASALGATALEWDTFARRAQLARTAQRAFTALDAETQAFVEAYVEGVNHALAPAAEHRALGLVPRWWEPWTPLAVFAVQHVLFATFPHKLWRHHLRRHQGPVPLDGADEGVLSAAGSNAFGVGGARTSSGLPLIGADPHRVFEAPGIYAQVHLAGPGFDVAGLTVPGVPGVQHFGHAGSVAWAVTHAMADYQDLYAEPLVRVEGRVWAEEEPVAARVETIAVRDGDDVTVELLQTARGPVVIGGPEAAESFSLRTPSWLLGDLGFGALLPLLHARTTADVEAALSAWVEPANAVVIADDAGSLAHRVVGRVPQRPDAHRQGPVAPSDDWAGWVDLPASRHDSQEIVVLANHRRDETYDVLGEHFAPSYRAERISALLAGRDDLDVDDLAVVLVDTYSARAGGLWDGEFAARRDALVAALVADPRWDAVRGGSPYGSLFDPWFDLGTWLAEGLEPGDARLEPEPRSLLGRPANHPGRLFWPLHGFEQFDVPHPIVDAVHEATAVRVSGDSDTVQAMYARPGSPVTVRGPVARVVWDLAERDRSRWVVPLGASGTGGAHTYDQLDTWAGGGLLPLITDWNRLEEEHLRA